MWFKYGLKAQKLLAQGIALGIVAVSKAPVRAKALYIARYFKASAARRVGRNLRNFSISAKAAVFDKTAAFSCFHKQKCIKTAYL